MGKTTENPLRSRIVGEGEEAPDQLLANPLNWRRHPKAQQDALEGMLRTVGWVQRVIVNRRTGHIVDGHLRVEVALRRNEPKIPVLYVDLTEQEEKVVLAAIDPIGGLAETDQAMLDDLLEGIQTGDEQLDAFLDSLRTAAPEIVQGLTDEDDVPEAAAEPVTKPGDIWVMGKHRLMCGDSTSIDAVDRLMPETADMVFTDPPYLMDFTGSVQGDGSKGFNAKHGRIANDKMSEQEGNDFLDAINTIIASKVRGAFYITFYRLGIDRYYASMQRTGLQCRSLIIWDKGRHTLSNSDYMSMYEPMFYGWVQDHTFYGGNNGMDIWRVERTKKNDLHPTMKPVALVEKAITDGSKAKDLVLDLFGGSGTTLIACEKTGRIARLMELDPRYCDVIVKRWQDFTGKAATLEANNRSFSDVASGTQTAAEAA